MVHIGIDIGTDSVRVCAVSRHAPITLEEPLTRAINGPCHTMNGEKLWSTISNMVDQACGKAEKLEGPEKGASERGHDERMPNRNLDRENAISGVAGSDSLDYGVDAPIQASRKSDGIRDTDWRAATGLQPAVTEPPKSAPKTETSSGQAEITSPPTSIPTPSSQPSPSNQPIPSTATLKKTPVSPSSICVAATCSMAVMQRVTIDKTSYYRALIPGQEVFVWMDSRAQQEAHQLSRLLPQAALAQVGGRVTPEMGLAKIMWINGRYDDVVVFELYDWISYLFVAGGIHDGLVRCLDDDLVSFGPGLTAMDGSVKGWSDELMAALGLKVRVGHLPRAGKHGSGFEYVGTPLDVCPPGPRYGGFSVCHGCIDCYGGWAGLVGQTPSNGEQYEEFIETIGRGASMANVKNSRVELETETIDCQTTMGAKNQKSGSFDPSTQAATAQNEVPTGPTTSTLTNPPAHPTSLYMVAGTLTCFIADIVDPHPQPISGLWGHFDQLAPRAVYSFGQPATGLLFGELFAAHRSLIGHHDPFQFVEARASELEASRGALLTVLTRQNLYYGDRHGNRSPYGDFSMGAILVDGTNAGKSSSSDELLACELTEVSVESLVVKYYLTLEYLVFQTFQLATLLQDATSPLGQVTVCGSQAHNQRFVQMLAQFVFANAKLMVGSSAKYAGAQGVAVAAAKAMDRSIDRLQAPALSTEPLEVNPLDRRDISILKTKYRYWHQLAQWQANFRSAMATV